MRERVAILVTALAVSFAVAQLVPAGAHHPVPASQTRLIEAGLVAAAFSSAPAAATPTPPDPQAALAASHDRSVNAVLRTLHADDLKFFKAFTRVKNIFDSWFANNGPSLSADIKPALAAVRKQLLSLHRKVARLSVTSSRGRRARTSALNALGLAGQAYAQAYLGLLASTPDAQIRPLKRAQALFKKERDAAKAAGRALGCGRQCPIEL